ncbi:uncharacterized protein [Periplaneta americana]|uniref:uncharacterized protein n=1 Tax=Periplaneta americana TaxID=6978 RepID=UPI0037E8D3A1
MKYSLEQRVFIYDNFVKYKSWRTVISNFRQSFPDSPEPSKAMIYNLVKKVRTTGSVLDKKRTCVKRVLTEEILDEIGHRLERSPTISSRRVAQQIGVSQSSVIRAMGKVRRQRQKYHLPRTDAPAASNDSVQNEEQSPEIPTELIVPENVFAGIDISLDNLKQSLKDCDVRSVVSQKILPAGNTISKKEKRRLRHELFVKKLDAAYQAKKRSIRRYKKMKKPAENKSFVDDKLPPLDTCLKESDENPKKKKRETKVKGIAKAKHRNKALLQDVELFKKLLEDNTVQADPVASVSALVKSRIEDGDLSGV